MHVGAKKIATAGLLVAFTIIMMVLGSVIETSTLFFIAAASFCVGIAIREWGILYGFAFLVASVVLNLLVAPNKLYCITFGGMGLYLWLYEWLWNRIANKEVLSHRNVLLWIGKFVFFNLLYVPALFFMPELLFAGKMNGLAAVLLLFGGQIALLAYDLAYRYFQAHVWGRLRKL